MFRICNEVATLDQEDMVIDESNSVNHGFKDLWKASIRSSVEDRLSAVVALIGVANEGNSIRIILEETAHEKSQKYKEGKSVLGGLISTNGLQQEKILLPYSRYYNGGFDNSSLKLGFEYVEKPVQYTSSSSSSTGGQIGATSGGNHLSLSMSNNQQRPFINSPQLFATAAASSGFPQQITTRPQNWLHQKSGFYSLMRPS
ncbi:hypothetical protein LOK49_LG07G00180 [Camellia lanceoleosa]|uniref:Uncharacterized protein n=1 Tax=Camellia lanceoleosa TaxID=1840588 RepID=A0ACC0H5M8_9ERIC|nr:hypothetical protein LOK49_LG07G00180 [Camellia lanceoleosa]